MLYIRYAALERTINSLPNARWKRFREKAKAGNKIPYFSTEKQIPTSRVNKGIVGDFIFINCQRWDYMQHMVYLQQSVSFGLIWTQQTCQRWCNNSKIFRDDYDGERKSKSCAVKAYAERGADGALLKKKNIREISVNELCEAAEINRTTFYRHYQTPHDVLIDIELDFAKLAQEKPLPSTARGDIKKHALYLCEFLDKHRDTMKLFLQNSADSDVAVIYPRRTEPHPGHRTDPVSLWYTGCRTA